MSSSSCGESYSSAARLAGVSDTTVDRDVTLYHEGGIEGLKPFDWQGPTSELSADQTSLEEEFRARPPHTTAEACRCLEEITGGKRGFTLVRHFLKKSGVEVALHSGDPATAAENRCGARGDSSGVPW